ncbi:MAG: response regulator [Opitutaceae bacterium]|nr:response regulator [Opitutaceae bacterium]
MAWCAVQALDGTMYFGTNSVVEFDGAHWKPHAVGNACLVRALAIGPQGRLWVGAHNELGYFERGSDGLGKFISLLQEIPPACRLFKGVWQVFPQEEGAVFIAQQHVLRWDGRRFEGWKLATEQRLSGSEVDGAIFIHHGPDGLYELRSGGPELLIPASLLGESSVLWLERNGNGFLLGTADGFFHFQEGRLIPFASGLSHYLQKNILTAVRRLPDGNLAIGTLYGGLTLASPNGEILRQFTAEDGLPCRTIFSLFVDRAGDLWITSSTHLARLPLRGTGQWYDRRNGLAGQDSIAMAPWGEGVAVATDDGLFLQPAADSPGKPSFVAETLMRARYWALQSTSFGLLAGKMGGLDLLRRQQPSSVCTTISKDVFSISPSLADSNLYYLGTSSDLLAMHREDSGAFSFTKVANFPDTVTSAAEAQDGSLWVGTFASGAFIVQGPLARLDSPAPVTAVSGLPAWPGTTEIRRVGEQLVVLTQQGGFIAAADGLSAQPLPQLAGLKHSAVSNHCSDGSVWLSVSRTRLGRETPPFCVRLSPHANHRVGVEQFEIEGLNRLGNVRSLLFMENQPAALWIGGSEGLLKVDPARLTQATVPDRPLLASVRARREDGTVLPFAAVVPFAANRLTFVFSSTEYPRAETLHFETRMLGLDCGWTPISPCATPCNYPRLREGDYCFQVRTVSPAGLCSEPAEWRFTVLPPWHRTLPAYAGYAFLTGLLLFGGVRFRLRSIQHRNRELEQLVGARTAELVQANAAKTQFVARLNHDIRNPINGILGLSLALADTPLTLRQRKLTASLQQCARYLASLVEEVLDFAQLESSTGTPPRAEPFDLIGTLTAAHATAQAQANEFGCRVALRLDRKLPVRVVGDAVRLQRIVANFLSNAVKFGGGQMIELSARVQCRDHQHVMVSVSVRDFGPGIGDKEQAQLFTQFFRGRHAKEQNIMGSGLGLAVCRLLAESMSGSVGVESALGRGSLFQVTLPLALAQSPASVPSMPPPKPVRVLLVEDEEYNAVATTAILRRLGYTVTHARDGHEALALLRTHRFDVAFIDWDLPLLNGGEIARRFRQQEPASRHTLLIATTAYATEEQRRDCFIAGMDGFVAKPLTPERIVAAMREDYGAMRSAPSIHVVAPVAASAPASAGAPDELDFTMLNLVTGSSPAELARRVREFLGTCESDLGDLRQAVDTDDCSAVRLVAHRLLNQTQFVRATQVSAKLIALQEAARAGETHALKKLFVATSVEFRRLSNRLSAAPFLPEPEATPTREQNG